VNERLELFWLFLSLVHFLIAMPEVQDNVLGCTILRNTKGKYKQCSKTLPSWYPVVFLFLYLSEAVIKCGGLGLTGGKFAWWTNDFYNKLDILALMAYIIEVAFQFSGGNSNFSLRGFRIVRLLKPLGQIGVFSDLETIFAAFGAALKPMATVLLFIWFVLILFGIMGMAIYGDASFRRRCVWADSLEVKSPEQWCKRSEWYYEYPFCTTLVEHNAWCDKNRVRPQDRAGTLAGEDRQPAALDNNCGPFQLCLDIGKSFCLVLYVSHELVSTKTPNCY
jgi:hypothetical protein